MVVVRQGELRSNIKKYLDLAYNGETIFVSRVVKKNVVIISEKEYNELIKLKEIKQNDDRL